VPGLPRQASECSAGRATPSAARKRTPPHQPCPWYTAGYCSCPWYTAGYCSCPWCCCWCLACFSRSSETSIEGFGIPHIHFCMPQQGPRPSAPSVQVCCIGAPHTRPPLPWLPQPCGPGGGWAPPGRPGGAPAPGREEGGVCPRGGGPLCRGPRGVPRVHRWGSLACCLAWVRPPAWPHKDRGGAATLLHSGFHSCANVPLYYCTSVLQGYCTALFGPTASNGEEGGERGQGQPGLGLSPHSEPSRNWVSCAVRVVMNLWGRHRPFETPEAP